MVACNSTPTTLAGAFYSLNLGLSLGTWIVGVCFTIFAQGILFMQAVEYIRLCRYDGRPTKILVAIVMVATFAKCGINFSTMWHLTVTTYGDYDGGGRLTWASSTNLAIGHVITFICQMFYLKRAWRVTRSQILTGLIALFCTASLICSIVMTVPLVILAVVYDSDMLRIDPRLSSLVSPFFISSGVLLMVADFLITGTMIRFLLTSRKDMVEISEESSSLLRRLIRVTLESAAPPLILAIVNIIVFSIMPGATVAVAFSLSMPSLYAICLMHTINHRCRNRILQNRDSTLQLPEQHSKQGACHCYSLYSSVPPRFANINTKGQVISSSTITTKGTPTKIGRKDVISATYTIPVQVDRNLDDSKSFDPRQPSSPERSGKQPDVEDDVYGIALQPIRPAASDQSLIHKTDRSSLAQGDNDEDWALPVVDSESPSNGVERSSLDEVIEHAKPPAISSSLVSRRPGNEKPDNGFV
ncbi:hypothetical protein FRC02_003778 [Tulasnella sp. 418]|nr:hypothetical protein FRC02_003778 [Tulasnella sp. 418]